MAIERMTPAERTTISRLHDRNRVRGLKDQVEELQAQLADERVVRHDAITGALAAHSYDYDTGDCICGVTPVDSVLDHIAREITRALTRPDGGAAA